MSEQEPKPPLDSIMTPGRLLATGAFIVLPVYVVLAWLIVRIAGPDPLLPASARSWWFGGLCGISLTATLASAPLAQPRKESPSKHRPTLSYLVALCLAEFPSVAGLLYFILYRDFVGLFLLLTMSMGAFAYVATRLAHTDTT